MEDRKTKVRIDIVWENRIPKRYIPLAYPDRAPGNLGWGVWDRREERYVEDKELRKIDKEKLHEIYAN